MSLYKDFETDTSAEKNGIVIDYGDFRVTVMRAGGSNNKFKKILEYKTKPYRKAIQDGSLSNDIGDRINREVYAEAVIANWETKDSKGNFAPGIEDRDGKVIPFCNENIIKTFENLPELFSDIVDQANKFSLFRKQELEEDSKN